VSRAATYLMVAATAALIVCDVLLVAGVRP
jgi:hypothetical protein